MPIARLSGIYRCPNDDQTIALLGGQEIPACSCGWDEWEFFKRDNIDQSHAAVVAINNGQNVIETDEPIEVDNVIRLRGGMITKFDGYYRISHFFLTKVIGMGDDEFVCIRVEKLKEYNDDELPIHDVVATMRC